MITDKNGNQLNIGDEVIVRGKIVAIPMDLKDGGKALLQVNWEGQVPLIDYVQSVYVEKANDSRPDTSA
ncbi:MAG: hypothetical protein WBV94_33600 [Blastocatellia bacterium]